MVQSKLSTKQLFTGIAFAIFTCVIWSGNFVVARGVAHKIPPISLAFYRLVLASIGIAPFAWKSFLLEKKVVAENKRYLLKVAFTGFAFYSSILYLSGHFTSAINLALISSTSAPIFAVLFGVLFFNEKIGWLRIFGMGICLMGVLVLLSQGSWQRLAGIQFSVGDAWALIGAASFAMYNNLAKQKPLGISSSNFLFVVFTIATMMLFPFFIAEKCMMHAIVEWNVALVGIIFYLGMGCSVVAYLLWNASILLLGASRTALFGNLMPFLSTLEAVFFLHEKFMPVHFAASVIVLVGLVTANIGVKGNKS